ncbi:TetR/AcrR family transcriptional regulator [Paenibacillus aceris]|uniref:AcrR family transcriptional regulator n=1 Tax=Paenibacillus aceris TaxID=869555 RepID=A0ABS4I0E8_9BACL|nr:TetR/AcrR family transcriptional regulator [Paenibacillus aceris]MBP1964360.1 AcrR family transcriptional regulator [Paenibacillus aceris]NHW36678.1 TetR/AcrR family transcriptional regulator [Paenibacillus aceris]
MVDSKKNKILDTAIELFRIKGYSAASMQDIAEACGMAKASIYKFFATKEELFTAAFVACHQTLLDQAAALDRVGAQLNLSSKEKLRRKIEFQLQYTVENHLFMIDFRELPITTNDQFIAAWKRKKNALHTWRRELLIETYGKQIEPYIWDVVAIFRGIHVEYLTYVQQKVIALPMSELAAFIVDRLDALIDDFIRTSPKPVIDESNTHFNYLNPSDTPARQTTVRQLFELMNVKIRELSKPDEVREELLKVSTMLNEECERQLPNPTLIRVFVSYLDIIPELRPYIRQLNYLIS